MNHRSSTPRLGSQPPRSVLSRRRRNLSVVVLPSFAPLPTPSAFTADATSLRWRLRSVALAARSRLLALLRFPHSLSQDIPRSDFFVGEALSFKKGLSCCRQ